MPTNAELAKEIEVFRVEMAEMRESMKLLNEICEGAKKENEILIKENKSLKVKNKELAKRLSELEQYSRSNNVEIRGVPVRKDENCLQIVQEIGNKAKCPVAAADIDIVHRVPVKKGIPHIIARFCTRAKRAEFCEKARKARLNTSNIGFQSQKDEPIFINDHLTPEKKRLFAQALTLKKEKNWKYLWTDNGIIKARKTDNSKVHRIADTDDLTIIS